MGFSSVEASRMSPSKSTQDSEKLILSPPSPFVGLKMEEKQQIIKELTAQNAANHDEVQRCVCDYIGGFSAQGGGEAFQQGFIKLLLLEFC